MKVLHILFSSHYSGAENVVCQIISLFSQSKDVDMVYCSPEGPVRQALENRNVPCDLMNEFSILEIKKAIKRNNPDVIHTHDMKATVYTSIATSKIPIVAHIHVNNSTTQKFNLKSLVFFIAAHRVKHLFWVSHSSFNGYFFHKYLEKKSTILYNVIDSDDLRRKAEIDKNTYNYDIVYIGRLTYQKNPQRLMFVIKLIHQKNPNVKVAIAGSGDLESVTRTIANEYELCDNIDFLGFLDNPYKILRDSKIMIMTSRWEGTPMSALEAMTLGVPIVSTPSDGLCELVDDGTTGFLCNDDEDIVNKCLLLINDAAIRRDFSHASMKKAEQMMDINYYKTSLLEVYKSVI